MAPHTRYCFRWKKSQSLMNTTRWNFGDKNTHGPHKRHILPIQHHKYRQQQPTRPPWPRRKVGEDRLPVDARCRPQARHGRPADGEGHQHAQRVGRGHCFYVFRLLFAPFFLRSASVSAELRPRKKRAEMRRRAAPKSSTTMTTSHRGTERRTQVRVVPHLASNEEGEDEDEAQG